jgi:hypothetical protein
MLLELADAKLAALVASAGSRLGERRPDCRRLRRLDFARVVALVAEDEQDGLSFVVDLIAPIRGPDVDPRGR